MLLVFFHWNSAKKDNILDELADKVMGFRVLITLN